MGKKQKEFHPRQSILEQALDARELQARIVPERSFPETQSAVLKSAAAGDWKDFFLHYLRPCWREVVLECRRQQFLVAEADDLFQELIVRLIAEARLSRRIQDTLAAHGQSRDFRGNLPARYLKYRELPLASVRFRTYLKGVINKLILETLRARNARSLDGGELVEHEPWIEESVSSSLDRIWISDCLEVAGRQLQTASLASRTKGRRRLFSILWMTVVQEQKPAEIAQHYGIDRTTVVDLLAEARLKYIAILQTTTGIEDLGELRLLVSTEPSALKEAFQRIDCQLPFVKVPPPNSAAEDSK